MAEAEGRDIVFPASVLAERGDVAATELQLHQSRQRELQSALEGLRQQIEQRKQELSSLRSRDKFLTESLSYVRQELAISSELAEKGYRSKLEVLRLQRNVADLTGQLQSARIAIPQAQAALTEAEQKLDERRQGFRSQALGELTQRKAELASLSEVQRAQADRVSRREVRSPVHGMIKQVKVHTVGGVIQPGGELMEIVPLDDQMIVEARVSPNDIAFIRPGQKATVKLTAYDYSIYGGLDAELEHISADSILTDRNEPYYLIRVRTTRAYLGSEERRLAVIPGMVASVDIVTGDKTVLQYLMKPILKTAERALRER
jgi:adhesin transport system membrane fusion protein